ncbi:MAG: GAF domain-containing protein [Candidatus Neomarinimicrobiota bacterium]|tara:strand:+ start:149 stop:586 length:438 start_codon:yes stop_codon:yes gene_type:complete
MLSTENKEEIYKICIESIQNYSSNDKLNKICEILFNSFDEWIFCGFYRRDGSQLHVEQYKSVKIPCSPITMNGVCGKAISKNMILNVPDVNEFPGHIVCDKDSKSEICIPIKYNNCSYVLDVDSNKFDGFDNVDVKYLSKILKMT